MIRLSPVPLSIALRAAAMVLGAHLLTSAASADTVPELNMEPTCRAAANSGAQVRPDVDGCLKSEERAKNTLSEGWTEFASADKQRCLQTTRMAGTPSYVQLLTCLETARDAKRLPRNETPRINSISR